MSGKLNCAIVVDKGHQMLMMPDGSFVPGQVCSNVCDSAGEQSTATITFNVNIFSNKEEALKFYKDDSSPAR